jgi:hypothetical protein
MNTGRKIFTFFFPNWLNCYPLMRTINFGKNLRLFQIQPIKTAEFKFIQFGKKREKPYTLYIEDYTCALLRMPPS